MLRSLEARAKPRAPKPGAPGAAVGYVAGPLPITVEQPPLEPPPPFEASTETTPPPVDASTETTPIIPTVEDSTETPPPTTPQAQAGDVVVRAVAGAYLGFVALGYGALERMAAEGRLGEAEGAEPVIRLALQHRAAVMAVVGAAAESVARRYLPAVTDEYAELGVVVIAGAASAAALAGERSTRAALLRSRPDGTPPAPEPSAR